VVRLTERKGTRKSEGKRWSTVTAWKEKASARPGADVSDLESTMIHSERIHVTDNGEVRWFACQSKRIEQQVRNER
jgi:hypothetical protein